MSTHKKEPASVVSGDKEQNADFYRTTHWTVSSIPVPQMARPSESILPPPLPTEKLSTCLQRYDLRLCLYGKNGEVYSEWEAVTSFLRRLQAIDDSIQLLPWQVGPDCGNKPPLAISQSTQFLFDLHTYVPRLSTETSLRTRIKLGHTRHPYLFLSSSVQLGTLVDKMGPWLRATKQGMWPRQLPLAEQTKCIGWLLYSAPEYNLDKLRRLLKQITGVDVALRFCCIQDRQTANAAHITGRVKAIHIEVEKGISSLQQTGLERIYSAKSRTFPLGIKMQLVSELQVLTNSHAYDKAIRLQSLQAKFLDCTETHWIRDKDSDSPNLSLPLYDTLRAMKLAHWSAAKSAQSLFHAISPMATKDGYLVRYLPQYATQARAAITKLFHQYPRKPFAPVVMKMAWPSQPNPSSTGATTVFSPQDALDQLFTTRFTKSYYLSPIPIIQLYPTGAQQTTHSRAPGPSHYQLYHWLLALQQLFQNTAWDRWQYCNDITKPLGI